MAVARAMWGYIERRDLQIMRRVHRWRAPRPIRVWMMVMTRLGDGPLWYGLGIVLLAFGGAQGLRVVIAGSLAAAISILLFRQLKLFSRRQRPCQIEPHCWAILIPPDQFSFPSGHTMTSFAVALVIGHAYPGLAPILFFLAVNIAISRIVLGMHFLTDVVVGALLGLAIGMPCLSLL